MAKMTNLNIELSKRTRQQFRKKCRSRGLSMKFAVSRLMQKVIDGEVPLGEVEKGKLVLNKK